MSERETIEQLLMEVSRQRTDAQAEASHASDRIVRLLRDRGFRVSVDTFNEDEALSGDAEGAEFLLSLNAQNMHLAGRLHAVPVVIGEPDGGVPSLLRNVQEARSGDQAQ